MKCGVILCGGSSGLASEHLARMARLASEKQILIVLDNTPKPPPELNLNNLIPKPEINWKKFSKRIS